MADLPDDMLRAFLAERDFECPVCRYNLRDLQTHLCPECGTKIQLQVGALEADQTSAIAGLIGLAAGAGFSGLLIVYLLIRLMIDQFHPHYGNFIVLTVTPFIIEGILIVGWLRNWRHIRKLSGTIKWFLAVSCWRVSLANLIIFPLFIR